jgi:hypothetical protein
MPPPTAEDYQRAMEMQRNDVTAPPTAGGLFPMFGGGGGPSGNVPPATTAPPSGESMYADTETTFSAEPTNSKWF